MQLTLSELQMLDRLLQQALDLPVDARAAWVDSLAPPYDTLAPLLRTHLEGADGNHIGEGVETADFLGGLPPLAGLADRSGDPVATERVGPYRLVRMLGEGGMSSVWLAERVDGTFKREVALKLPHRHLLDRGLAARMQRERDILAALNHDHIARLYDAGVDEHGIPYLAIEYVTGQPITNYCREHALDIDERLKLMVQVARAVAHAHANLVVHRDLKPNNIMVTAGDAEASVKLLDFGIAKLLSNDEGASGSAADLTQLLGRALTPDYASPEQIRELPVTTASDIYSLGVVLYEVITSDKPYKLKRQSAAALAEAVMNADVMRPSKRAAQSTDKVQDKHKSRVVREARRIEGDLDAIVMKALKAEPQERYATASAMADDLERFLAHQPVLAQPDSFAYRARRFVGRHALAVSAGSAVLLALVGGAGVALWQAREAQLETAKTRAVKDFLLSIITVGNIDQQDAALRRKQPIGDVLLDAARAMPGKFAAQPEVRSEVQGLLGAALDDLSMHDSAKVLRETRLTELNARGAPLIERMQAQVDLAITVSEGDNKRGTQLLNEAIAVLGDSKDARARMVAAQALRGTATTKMERYDGSADGVKDAERALAIAEALEPGSKTHVASLSLLGLAHALHRDLPNAEIAFEKAIVLAQSLPPADRGYEATVRQRYAEALIPRRFHQRALVQFTEALKIIERTAGADTFRWARTAVMAANLTAAMGDAPRAIAMFEQVLQVYAKFGTELDPLFVSAAHAMYAECLVDYGRFGDGVRMADAGYAPYRATVDASVGALWLAATRYAHAMQAVGNYAQAENALSQALAASRAANVSRSYSAVPGGERLLALNYLYRGNHDKAQAMLKDVIAIDGAPVERFASQRNFAHLGLASSYLAQGKLAEAEAEIAIMAGILGKIAPDEVAISRPAAAQLESLSGSLRMARGDAVAATSHFQRSIELQLPRQHPQSPHLASARADLALALATQGKRAQAQALADQARTAFARHLAMAPHFKQGLVKADRILARR